MSNLIHIYDTRKDQNLTSDVGKNPLPHLLQLPSGLAILELQGTINLPDQIIQDDDAVPITGHTTIGRLVFPDYDPQDKNNTAWMKPVYMYVGKHQRLTGEVKKLPKAIAVVRKKARELTEGAMDVDHQEEPVEDLEIVEIVKHKIIFSSRPEPVGVYEGGS